MVAWSVLAFWAGGIAMSLVDGGTPSPWVARSGTPFVYPVAEVLLVCVTISVETLALYAVLEWSPLRRAWRVVGATAVATFIVLGLLLNFGTDRPGYEYTNLKYAVLILAVLCLTNMCLGLRWALRRVRRPSTHAT